ncbi:hypothetical protein M501DRAFT_1032935 [Patellaria atrata CBS 101060]|uniref:Uncharacterized protein n=1 Tax=Patellaria atrata CBS 101060 TaxID=1346257 RepID=A0A9P4VL71_9PEZI|nr:hypothetical protein M501DRAFT_1032935 [Patellaria atrata CBS 101060]
MFDNWNEISFPITLYPTTTGILLLHILLSRFSVSQSIPHVCAIAVSRLTQSKDRGVLINLLATLARYILGAGNTTAVRTTYLVRRPTLQESERRPKGIPLLLHTLAFMWACLTDTRTVVVHRVTQATRQSPFPHRVLATRVRHSSYYFMSPTMSPAIPAYPSQFWTLGSTSSR